MGLTMANDLKAGAGHEEIVIIDFGSQYTQLIARRVRELNVFCRILPPTAPPSAIRSESCRGIILSGGPASVYDEGAPSLPDGILDLGVPVLGVCYGLHLLARAMGIQVEAAKEREFGHRRITVRSADPLFLEQPVEQVVWMSHGDQLLDPEGLFETLAATETCPQAAVRHKDRPLFGLQFHPEVSHSEHGKGILNNFLKEVCGCHRDWSMASFVDEAVARIREQAGDRQLICGVSGGVDSMVAAALVHRAVGEQLHCIFVDNGLLREDEGDEVERSFRRFFAGLRFTRVEAGSDFLSDLKGVVDPERKRKLIGHRFIDVFKNEAQSIEGADILVQGTLYPDVIESVSAFGGPTATIKTHHNVGGLPEELGFELCEPLRDLFKDEVRALGTELGLPEDMVWRQPFPGPGLAVRILGEISEARLSVLRKADKIVRDELDSAGLSREIWQAFAVLLPVNSVGVMGDQRTYDNVCAIRAVTSTDAMTAEWARIPYEVLAEMSRRIVNEVRGINRVVYDISSKPPSTIEWE